MHDVAWKTTWERLTIQTDSKRGSGRSELTAQHDDDDDDDDDTYARVSNFMGVFIYMCLCISWIVVPLNQVTKSYNR